MTFKELEDKLKEVEELVSNLRSEGSKNTELINTSSSQLKPLIEQIKTLQSRSDERTNISLYLLNGRVITGTTDVSAGTESTHPHYLSKRPSFVFITEKSNGVVYLSKDYDNTNIYVKGSANSLDFEAFCII